MSVPSPRVAVALVEELMSGGVRDVVLAPGSRSAPLALTLADAERRGLIRLHVRIDERSAAYTALGIARVAGAPVAVVTTSGTAAVNLHPAIVEAAYSGVPLVAVTADRPGEMRGTGANQTIDQRGVFEPDVVAWADLGDLAESDLRAAVADAIDLATGLQSGPVHLNVPLVEPLVGAGQHAVTEAMPRMRDTPSPEGLPLVSLLQPGVDAARGILVVGDFDDDATLHSAGALAEALGWPILSEPSGNLSSHSLALHHGPLLLDTAGSGDRIPDVVVTVGRVGLHRSVAAVVRSARAHIAVDVPPRLGRVDPLRTASAIVDAVPLGVGVEPDPEWIAQWRAIDEQAAHVVAETIEAAGLTGPHVARIVAARAGAEDLLVVGASWPVRHVSAYAGPLRARCLGNRGTSGIDGVVSTAWGSALAHADRHPKATTYALMGDLTSIYDRNGLLAPLVEPRPRLDIVVIDNDGGGIFSALEQGAPDFAADFERVFGTPHGAQLSSLLEAPGVDVIDVATAAELIDVLADETTRVRVIIARCAPREAEAALVTSVQAAVDAALT